MKSLSAKTQRSERAGYALLVVLVFSAVGLLLVSAIISRTVANSRLTHRSNEYFDAVEASEAATEKVLAELSTDFLDQGPGAVAGKMSTYHSRVPKKAESAHWNKFIFKDKQGNRDATEVDLIAPWATAPLISQYQGLSGYAATYRISSYAQDLDGGNDMVAAIQQDLQLAIVPVFQFAIFYNMDMEMCPGPNMTVSGRVHGNDNIYLQPDGGHLTFVNDVTSAGNIVAGKSPDDPSNRSPGPITFDAAHDSGVGSMNLPIGTNNSPAAVHAIIEIPPNGESPNSQMGEQRLYNQADLIVLVYNDHVDVHGGNNNNGNGANVQWTNAQTFVSTNVSFYNKREGKTVKATQIDVGDLATWFQGQSAIKGAASLYVADLRSQNSSTEPGVRLVNGQTLMASGLTVATSDPLYVEGNYNVDSSTLGTSDTSKSRPAAFIADSITVLSGNWNDSNSSKSLSNRNAADTTVNAAFLAGIVPSGNGYYSGGVENFPRFLENWSGHKFTYNGSMVVMFPSQIAAGPWKGTGGTYDIYNPPTRNWNFDLNFTDPTKLPPLTPAVRTAIRGSWKAITPR